MKKTYKALEIEVISFTGEDIICTSGESGEEIIGGEDGD